MEEARNSGCCTVVVSTDIHLRPNCTSLGELMYRNPVIIHAFDIRAPVPWRFRFYLLSSKVRRLQASCFNYSQLYRPVNSHMLIFSPFRILRQLPVSTPCRLLYLHIKKLLRDQNQASTADYQKYQRIDPTVQPIQLSIEFFAQIAVPGFEKIRCLSHLSNPNVVPIIRYT